MLIAIINDILGIVNHGAYFCTERKFFMKHNKLFAVLAMAATMTLAACGGPKTSASTPAGNKSSKAPSVTSKEPPKPVKAASIDEIKLVKKDADKKVYVQFKGSETLYTAADKLQYAFGVSTDTDIPEADETGAVSSENFVYGKAVPEAANFIDITFTPAADAAKVNFEFEYCLTDIADVPTGVYHFFGGFTAADYAVLEWVDDNSDFQARDAKYDYFIRNDQSANGLAVENLGPFAISSGDFVKNPAEGHEGIYLKLGGKQATPFTQETADAWNTLADFQRMANYTKPTNLDKFWVVEGDNAWFYISIGNMTGGEDWMMHLTANAAPRTRDAGKALGNVDFTKTVEFADENLKLTVISDTTKGQNDGEAAYYGAIGVHVEYIVEPAPAEGGEEA